MGNGVPACQERSLLMTREDVQHTAGLLEFIDLTPDQARSIDEICDYFEHQLYVEGRPRIERLLGGFREPERSVLLRELLHLELETWLSRDSVPQQETYLRRFPGHEALVRDVFATVFPRAAPQAAELSPDEPEEDRPVVLNYRILRPLGEGGMGRVYEAIHTKLGTRVALKVIRKDLASDLEAEARFEREMRIIGTLAHPNIVAARDAGKTDEHRHYLVMEYVEGLDLAALLKRLGTLAVADACEIARGIALALQDADEHHLVHRDIKPKNVLLGRCPPNLRDVRVKVADFGLATLRGYAALRDPSVAHVRPGVAGTFAYMAPEQFWEQTSDIRSDLYSLGCTLYCLLVGRPPFARPQYQNWKQVMEAHRQAPVPALRNVRPDVSETLEQVISKLMAKDPRRRFQTPKEIAEELAAFTVGQDLAGLLQRAETLEDAFAHPPGAVPEAGLPDWPRTELATDSSVHTPSSELSDTRSWAPPGTSDVDFPKADEGRFATPEPALSAGAASGASEGEGDRLRPHGRQAGRESPGRISRRRMFTMLATAAGLGSAAVWGLRNLPRSPQPTDLLARIDLERDAIRGRWTLDGTSLVSPDDEPEARLRLAATVPDEYRLEIQARRVSGGSLVVGLVWNGRQVPVNLGYSVRLGGNAATNAVDPSALAAEFGFRGGPPETYVCIVRRKGYLVAYEEQVLDAIWQEAGAVPSGQQPEFADPPLDLRTHYSHYRFSRIVLTPLGR